MLPAKRFVSKPSGAACESGFRMRVWGAWLANVMSGSKIKHLNEVIQLCQPDVCQATQFAGASQPGNCLPRAVRCSWGSWQPALPSEEAVGSARAFPASAASLSSVSRPGFPCFLGKELVSLPFPGTSLSFLATFFPCSRRERTAPRGLKVGRFPSIQAT